MSCKSLIYAAMTSAASVAVNALVPLGAVIRKLGSDCQLSGNSVLIKGHGYYNVNACVVAAPATTDGTITVTLYKDGVAVAGATASVTSTTGDPVTIPIIGVVRVPCCISYSALTLVLSGTASTVSNVAMVVEKV